MSKNVLVFVERRDGEIKRASLEAVSTGRGIADSLGGELVAVAVGSGAGDAASSCGAHGADRLLVADAEHLDLYTPDGYARCVAAAQAQAEAGIVLLSSTAMGKDLAARVTARLGGSQISDCIEIAAEADGTLRGKRPVYSGKAFARVSIPGAVRPAVATLRPNVFPLSTADGSRSAACAPLEGAPAAGELKTRTVKLETAGKQELDVAEASVIVSGGRGLKGPENFSLVRDLADALGAAVGASRAVVDDGWIPHNHQVGQTGKVVSPNLYVAVGISGAIQHLAGMSSSKVIVAINKDAEAPIFKVADYGIVGDLFEVLPELTQAVRNLG